MYFIENSLCHYMYQIMDIHYFVLCFILHVPLRTIYYYKGHKQIFKLIVNRIFIYLFDILSIQTFTTSLHLPFMGKMYPLIVRLSLLRKTILIPEYLAFMCV